MVSRGICPLPLNMAITVMLDRGGDLTESTADEATECLIAHGVWWRRSGTAVSETRLIYQPLSAPDPQPSGHESWAAQIAAQDSWGIGGAATRER